MITIVDYGVGNIRAIANMLKRAGAQSIITQKKEEIGQASKIILPGVGAFDTAMQQLHEYKLIDILQRKVLEDKTPLLGICLGMQLLFDGSAEGSLKGLGWLHGTAQKFIKSSEWKVPQMNWNTTTSLRDSVLTTNLNAGSRFYFVHSYFLRVNNYTVLQAEYGCSFSAAVQKENIFGVQFHPEKSHKYGLQLLTNFVAL